ncbi:MAG: hypothetical protein CO032_07900 [Nitrosopumilales archaeon CG_4_9_14_0_2_um_filter_34_16]|nr:MAG: hypothetical protein CO032_07900 [Nitrosopumilales archaeon CG_4_9_14_0_2_um_filter_34_16]
MDKEDKKKEDKPKKSNFKAFLRKRAPFYLAGIALIAISAYGVLTEKNLEGFFPEFTSEEEQIVDILMKYDGPNESGLTVMQAIENKIKEEYPDEKVFDNKKTKVELNILKINSDEYRIILNFQSHKGAINYDWNVNANSEKIISNNPESKYIINLVDFYD